MDDADDAEECGVVVAGCNRRAHVQRRATTRSLCHERINEACARRFARGHEESLLVGRKLTLDFTVVHGRLVLAAHLSSRGNTMGVWHHGAICRCPARAFHTSASPPFHLIAVSIIALTKNNERGARRPQCMCARSEDLHFKCQNTFTRSAKRRRPAHNGEKCAGRLSYAAVLTRS